MSDVSIAPMKRCGKCGVVKSVNEFHKKSDSPDGLRAACKPCRAIERLAYYETHKEQTAEQGRIYRATHIESTRERHRKYQSANREKGNAAQDRYRKRHPDRVAAYTEKNKEKSYIRQRSWAKAHPERVRESVKRSNEKHAEKRIAYRQENKDASKAYRIAWRAANPEARTVWNQTRRAARMKAGGSHTRKEIAALLITQNYVCASPVCDADLRVVKRHLDHIQPFYLGGTNNIDNLQWLCAECNLRKSRLSRERWLQKEMLLRAKT